MKNILSALVCLLTMCGPLHAESDIAGQQQAEIPADIKAILQKPAYENSIWGLRVVDLDSGKVLIDFRQKTILLSARSERFFRLASC
jgi:D-alanyl-D-alanine carboxypeptidase